MQQNIKIAKNSLILYFRLIITSIIGVIATRIVLKNLGVSDYGLYSIVGSVVMMMNFFNTVMVTTTYRFIAFEMGRDDGRGANKVFNISLIIHIAMIFVVLILAETLGIWYINNKLNIDPGKLYDAIFVFRLSVLATVINIISIPFQGLITAMENFRVRASIEIIRAIFRLVFVISLGFFLGNKLRIYAVMMTILALVPSSLFILYCKRVYSKIISWNLQNDKEKYKEMIAFSGWTMIGASAYVGKATGSQLIINAFFGTVLNAAFGIANQLNKFIIMFSSNLGQAAIPQITKSFSGGDHLRSTSLVAYISKYSFLLMLIPALPILLETEFLLRLWLGEVPAYTVAFSRLMIINGLIDSLYSGIPSAIQASGKIKWFHIITSTIMLLSLPIAYVLFKIGYPPFCIQVIYISTAIINIFISLVLLKKIINFDVVYLIKTSYLRVSFVVVSILPFFLIKNLFTPSLIRFILISTISIIFSLLMIYLIGFEHKEKILVSKGIIFLKNKLRSTS